MTNAPEPTMQFRRLFSVCCWQVVAGGKTRPSQSIQATNGAPANAMVSLHIARDDELCLLSGRRFAALAVAMGEIDKLSKCELASLPVTHVSVTSAQQLQKALAFPHLKGLAIDFDAEDVRAIIEALATEPRLEVLILLGEADAPLVEAIARHQPALRELTLLGRSLTNESLQPLSSLRQLESIALVGAAANERLAKILASLPHLRTLSLRRTQLSDAAARILGTSSAPIESLEISSSGISGRGFHALCNLPLRALTLRDINAVSSQFSAPLARCKRLERLQIPAFDRETAEVLATLPRLRSLTTSLLPVHPSSATPPLLRRAKRALARAQIESLAPLKLSSLHLSVDDLSAVAALDVPSLRVLTVRCHSGSICPGPMPVHGVARAIASQSHLQQLTVSVATPADTWGPLAKLRALTQLEVRVTKDARPLLQTVQRMPQLRRLSLQADAARAEDLRPLCGRPLSITMFAHTTHGALDPAAKDCANIEVH